MRHPELSAQRGENPCRVGRSAVLFGGVRAVAGTGLAMSLDVGAIQGHSGSAASWFLLIAWMPPSGRVSRCRYVWSGSRNIVADRRGR
jgi:hypothetical protein